MLTSVCKQCSQTTSFASLLLLSVVLSDLSLSSVKCFSWCPLIKPNDNYKGLTLYNRLDRNNIVEYWMNNREGVEWRFHVTTDRQLRPDNTSIRNVKPLKISGKVSTLVTRFVSLDGQKVRIDCDVYRHEDNQTKLIYCGKIKCLPKKLKDFPRKYIFVGPVTLNNSAVLFVELNKKDKTKTRFKYIFVEGQKPILDREPCFSDRRHEKVCDLFVDRMNDYFYRRLDSTLRFYGNESNEELLLFKLKNRPKYCFQSLEENSNKKVTHKIS